MNKLNSSGADSHGAAVVITCSSCGNSEEHFTQQGLTKVGKPYNRCRK